MAYIDKTTIYNLPGIGDPNNDKVIVTISFGSKMQLPNFIIYNS